MKAPLVVIVGRPNVGKSTLFNRLLGRRVAVVHREPGTTRDRIYGEVVWGDCCFQLVDTGGLIPAAKEGLSGKIREHAGRAIREASLCLLVVDAREGLTPLDEEVAGLLRSGGKAVLVAVNKSDNPRLALAAADFAALGFEPGLSISALHGLAIADLLDAVVRSIPCVPPDPKRERTALAIVGRPNVGKSTLVNLLLGEERVLVDEVPGTTRDAIDTPLTWEGKNFLLIDTAGLRRKMDSKSALDVYSLSRTRRSVARAEIVLLLIEAPHPATRVDATFIKLVLERGKGCVIGVNKWDLAGSLSPREYEKDLQRKLPFAAFVPVVFFSALKDPFPQKVMELCAYVEGERKKKVRTTIINRVVQQAQEKAPARRRKHKTFRIYYATQVGTAPPVFRLFVNDPALLSRNYELYLINCLRRALGFEGVPLRLVLKGRSQRKS